MNRIDRLMGIVTLLQSKKQCSIRQISEHYSISERTVFRDLRALGEIGVPIAFDPETGYSVAGGFFLPPVSLTLEEANALALTEPLALRFAEKAVAQHISTALAKIKMVLGRTQRENLEQIQTKTAHFIPTVFEHMLPDTNFLTVIQNAILQKTILRIEYANAQGETNAREVEAIGLTFYSLNWHLIGWCHLRHEYRDFRVDRIVQLQISMKPFQKNDHIELDFYLANLDERLRREHL
jgi:predicted DNA-binding transcriptional regulator YafY